MECLNMIKSLKINLKRNIGTVVIIVEGAVYEFEIMKQIFKNVLHYEYIEKRRTKSKFKEYKEFVMKGNENSRVVVINHSESNIKNIKENCEYTNELYKMLYLDYGIDIKNVPVYIVWDRDRFSNDYSITKNLLKELGNAQENINCDMNGILLLSYPSVEAFVIDNFDSSIHKLKQNNIKEYIKESGLLIKNINRYTLLKAVVKMHNNLKKLGITNYNLVNFSPTSLAALEKEEKYYAENKCYMLLSFISIILIDLNIIAEQ